jgi:hypothetical protein
VGQLLMLVTRGGAGGVQKGCIIRDNNKLNNE